MAKLGLEGAIIVEIMDILANFVHNREVEEEAHTRIVIKKIMVGILVGVVGMLVDRPHLSILGGGQAVHSVKMTTREIKQ